MDEAPLRLEGLEPALRPGEVLALVGDGAEARLLALAGLAAPADKSAFLGRAWLGEREITDLPAHRRGLGAVLAPPGLFPGLSVARNIAWPLRLGRAEKAARVAGAIAALELETLADRLAESLSPDEEVRMALARAVAMRPAALLLQDPFARLDAAAREALALRLRLLGPPVLLATRDAGAALSAADRVGVFQRGELRQLGSAREVYERPADAVVAALTGPVNRLRGVVEEAYDDEIRVRLHTGAVVDALATSPLPAGARCLLLVRPERLAVAAMAAEAMGEGALSATLTEAVQQGPVTRLRLVLPDGTELLARRPTGLRLPGLGQPCAVAWDMGHALAFPV
jgi:putative spermidine/putrescine transport system ATP-binding protein